MGNEVSLKFQLAFEILGRKWNGLILFTLLKGSKRFTEIKKAIPGLSDRVLVERLKELEQIGLVRRNVYTRMPIKVEYELTKKGETLEKVMQEVYIWSEYSL